ncbi:hypothetical protein XENOCAPTIV_005675 [Xenoophorus captivus]|uniref:Uncharacterized protein n=1 Tax=Xenoophorus captivus TaxID=1517983 RepID=A0ABV0R8C7_9TELE
MFVHTHDHLGILADDFLTCKPHLVNLVKRMKLMLGFYFQKKLCFSNIAKKTTCCCMFGHCWTMEILCMTASSQCLQMIDLVYFSSLRFITTHHSEFDWWDDLVWPPKGTAID